MLAARNARRLCEVLSPFASGPRAVIVPRRLPALTVIPSILSASVIGLWLACRRRRRFATFAVGLAAAAASAVAVDRRFVRGHDPTAAEPALPATATGESVDPELRAALGSLSFNHAMAPVAKWTDIERPVRNYRVLLRKGGPK